MPRQDPQRLQRIVGRRIAELRQARGLTQGEFSERLGTSEKYAQRCESGTVNFTIWSLCTIANALGVTVAELLVEPTSLERTAPGRPRRRQAAKRASSRR